MTEQDKEFHSRGKPHFSETGILVYTGKGTDATSRDSYDCNRVPIAGAQKDVRFKQLPTFADVSSCLSVRSLALTCYRLLHLQ
jgi:nuclear pore complex protein Nup98-Nup96